MALFLPLGIHAHVEVRVALKRMEEFLRLPEQEPLSSISSASTKDTNVDDVNRVAATSVAVDGLSCAWVSTPVLKNISFRLGESIRLLCVAGPVGSGKSTLLMALLGELAPASGTVNVTGSVAYASQEVRVPATWRTGSDSFVAQAWILSTTIKENVLFGEPFDEEWYEKVLFACALQGLFHFMIVQHQVTATCRRRRAYACRR